MPKWLKIQLINYWKNCPDEPDDETDWNAMYEYLNGSLGPFSFDKEQTHGRKLWAWVNRQMWRAGWMYDYSGISVGGRDYCLDRGWGPPCHVDGSPSHSNGRYFAGLKNAEKRELELYPIARRICAHYPGLTDSRDCAEELLTRYHRRKDGNRNVRTDEGSV